MVPVYQLRLDLPDQAPDWIEELLDEHPELDTDPEPRS